MMLGMEARSSIAAPIGPFSLLGAISVRNMAMPMLMGTAMTMAIAEETSVPHIEGRAPNWSATGSQVLVQMKPRPKALIESQDSFTRTAKMSAIRAMTEAAKNQAMPLKTASPIRPELYLLLSKSLPVPPGYPA